MQDRHVIVAGCGLWTGRLLSFETLPSTNQWCKDHIGACTHGDVVLALSQPSGKGRLGRTWISPPGKGLTFSVVLRPPGLPLPDPANLGQAAAIAVRRVLSHHSIDSTLKWPNDVLADGRKIAGILVDQISADPEAVIGIGLNVNASRSDLADRGLGEIATSMAQLGRRQFDPVAVLQPLVGALQVVIDRLTHEGLAWLMEEWKRHDALTGQEIELQTATGVRRGRYAGLSADGRLCLADAAGRRDLFWTGDVVRLRPVAPPITDPAASDEP